MGTYTMFFSRSLVFFLFVTLCTAYGNDEKREKYALNKFYDALGGNDWTPKTWSKKDAVWKRAGIDFNWRTRRVREISLNVNNLSGKIPKAVKKLKRVKYMFLANNNITGTIPTELGNLENLGRLYLRGNELVGPPPTSLCEKEGLTILVDDKNSCPE